MTEPDPPVDPLAALFEGYLNGQLDDAQTGDLEARLLADDAARRAFVRYVRLHTDLLFELQARQASDRVLDLIGRDLTPPPKPRRRFGRRLLGLLATAAALLLAVGLGSRLTRGEDETVAWLENAQNCAWADGERPGELRPGRSVRIDRGLAEVRFRCGARLVIEGPAHLDLVSGRVVRLHRGRLTARVPPEAIGFEVLSPQGKVIDLGTEFGIAVGASGEAEVYVFEGKVEAHAAGGPGKNLTERQAARIEAGRVTATDADPKKFVRDIVPTPAAVVARSVRVGFDRPTPGTLPDLTGAGTGLTHRLPGTGGALFHNDEYMALDTARGRLELTPTRSDLNRQFRLHQGEYLGLRLSDLGYTGAEDFEVSAVFPDTPELKFIGQFGLYAGARSDRVIRGGVLKVNKQGTDVQTQFLVNNPDGWDVDLHEVGLLGPGTDVRLTLRRLAGKYTLTVEDLTGGGASTLAIRHPDYLDREPDLYVGLFAAEPRSDVGQRLLVKELRATVWVPAPAGGR
ncbi:MAG TPA: FecR domain-containing protein, partial [Gemmataceae bacterium]|nr:FecR domain-containing protein [Gemmataceae bacterium]